MLKQCFAQKLMLGKHLLSIRLSETYTDTHPPPVKAPPELSCTESIWAGLSSRIGQRAHQLQTTIQVPTVNSSGRTTQRQLLALGLSHTWTAFCWENILQGAGGKGMEVAAPSETRNLGLKELDPQGTPAVQAVEAGGWWGWVWGGQPGSSSH